MAQRDPLVEYQREGFLLFQAMLDAIKEESVGYLFNLEVQVEQPAEEQETEAAPILVAEGLVTPKRPAQLQYSAPSVDDESGVETRSEGSSSGERASGSSSSGNRAERRGRRKRG